MPKNWVRTPPPPTKDRGTRKATKTSSTTPRRTTYPETRGPRQASYRPPTSERPTTPKAARGDSSRGYRASRSLRLAHVAHHSYDIHHGSIAALDCENAYGTLARTAILQIMMALAAAMGPESAATALLMHVLDVYAIAGPTHMWLSNGNGTSRVHTIYQTDGIDQGENTSTH